MSEQIEILTKDNGMTEIPNKLLNDDNIPESMAQEFSNGKGEE